MGDLDSLLYPKIDLIDGRAIMRVFLPEEYEDRVRRFYEAGYKDDIEEYAQKFEQDLRLIWHDTLGLKNISLGGAGFDLDHNCTKYAEHNIWTLEQAVPLFLVATQYVSFLL